VLTFNVALFKSSSMWDFSKTILKIKLGKLSRVEALDPKALASCVVEKENYFVKLTDARSDIEDLASPIQHSRKSD